MTNEKDEIVSTIGVRLNTKNLKKLQDIAAFTNITTMNKTILHMIKEDHKRIFGE